MPRDRLLSICPFFFGPEFHFNETLFGSITSKLQTVVFVFIEGGGLDDLLCFYCCDPIGEMIMVMTTQKN